MLTRGPKLYTAEQYIEVSDEPRAGVTATEEIAYPLSLGFGILLTRRIGRETISQIGADSQRYRDT